MSLPQRADVVVIGGGIFGCVTALHLLERGVEDVLVLERDGLAQATSHAGGGFVGRWGGGYVPAWGTPELVLEAYALDFYRALAEDHGLEFGYKRNGSLWAATTPEAWDAFLERIATHAEVENKQTLSAAEVEEITGGVILASGVVGGVLHPDGCQVQAPRATTAIARLVEEAGGQIRTRTPVTRLVAEGGRIRGVETAEGTIAADNVVVAAGAWTNVLLRLLGAWMPMVPLIATRIITEPLGVPRRCRRSCCPSSPASGSARRRGASCGAPATASSRARSSWSRIPSIASTICRSRASSRPSASAPRPRPRCHCSLSYRNPRVAQGAPTYTPDLRGVVTGVPEADGLWVIGGDNEAGITHGPGYARLLADLVVDGGTSHVHRSRRVLARALRRQYTRPEALTEWASQPLLRPEEDASVTVA